MPESFDLDQIRDFWTQQAAEHGASPAASWSDVHMIDLEIRTLLEYVRDNIPDRVRPVGETCSYSNYGSALAGFVVERVAGVPFDHFVEPGPGKVLCALARKIERGATTVSVTVPDEGPALLEHLGCPGDAAS